MTRPYYEMVLCAKHGNQVALLNGKRICFACFVDKHAWIRMPVTKKAAA